MKKGVKITCTSENGRQAVISNGLPLSAYWLDHVDGLDGGENTINTVKGSGQAGETFISMSPNKRLITIFGQLLDCSEASKSALKRAYNIGYGGNFVYQYNSFIANIDYKVKRGVIIEKDTPNFSVVLECPDPYFKIGSGAYEQWIEIAAWSGGLEFDFEIPEEGIGFEERQPSLTKSVYNEGDADVGLKIRFRASGDLENPSIVHVGRQETLTLDMALLAGDEVIVSTVAMRKSAVLNRGGVKTNVINKLKGLPWLKIYPEDNLIRYNADPIENIDVAIAFERLLEAIP